MQDIIAGATNYQNQPIKEIADDLQKMIKYSKDIIKKNKKALQKLKMQADLKWIYQEIVLFAEKLVEISKNNFRKLKKGEPTLFYCEKLIEIGSDAYKLNLEIGKTWHGNNNYEAIYNFNSNESYYYRELRDYILSMIDLNNIGHDVKNRYFKNGEPLYKQKEYWKYIRDFLSIIINAIFNFFKTKNI